MTDSYTTSSALSYRHVEPSYTATSSPEQSPYMPSATFTAAGDRRFGSSQLHSIDESSELSDTAIQDTRPGKMRKNLLSGFRRVAKAVKSAAKQPPPPRKFSMDSRGYAGSIGNENISHLHMPAEEARPSLLRKPSKTQYTVSLSMAPGDSATRQAPVVPALRQRSLTQQTRAPPQMSRTPLQQRVRSHHGGLPRVHTSSSLASMDCVSSVSSLASQSPRHSGDIHMSPLSQSPRSIASAHPHDVPAANRPFVSCEFPKPAAATIAAGPATESAPPLVRSADAVLPAMQSTAAAHSIYPKRRDRSRTLPGNQHTQPPLSPPPARVRRKTSVPQYNPELSRLAKDTAAPETSSKIDLPIPRSPLMKPSTQESAGQSAGARIHKQAVRNISKLPDELLMMPLLPSPADTASNQAASAESSQELGTSLSRMTNSETNAGSKDQSSQSLDTSHVSLDPQYASIVVNSDKFQRYRSHMEESEESVLKLSSESRSSEQSPVRRAEGASIMQALKRGPRSIPEQHSDIKYAHDSGVLVGADRVGSSGDLSISGAYSASTSQHSLPIFDPNTTPPSPFSFGHHSRYSLINHDGSLNLINYQFDQLDGYQKRLSPPPVQRSESKLSDRFLRKTTDTSRSPSGNWIWATESAEPMQRQRRLMRKPRKQTPSGMIGFEPLQPLSVNMWTTTSDVQPSFGSVNSNNGSIRDRSLSISTTHSALNTRISDSASSIASASQRVLQPTLSLTDMQRRSSETPSLSSLRRTHSRWPRLMQIAPESVPFDSVYSGTIASISMEQALTFVDSTASRSIDTTPRHRRLHKRSASALTVNELDDIMIRTVEMCHSVQAAIRTQADGESGLGQWIASVVGKPQAASESSVATSAEAGVTEADVSAPAAAQAMAAAVASIEHSAVDTAALQSIPASMNDRDDTAPGDHLEFFSAGTSPDTPNEQFVSLDLATQNDQPGQSPSCEWSPENDTADREITQSAAHSLCSSDSQDSIVVQDPVVTMSASSPHNHPQNLR
ncbi:hypothetical protein EV183_004642 [Coemansia sp. RSA 2336]|nr:hypothetical protein EV183_004642 [Coemansia sp. RSA 2336]